MAAPGGWCARSLRVAPAGAILGFRTAGAAARGFALAFGDSFPLAFAAGAAFSAMPNFPNKSVSQINESQRTRVVQTGSRQCHGRDLDDHRHQRWPGRSWPRLKRRRSAVSALAGLVTPERHMPKASDRERYTRWRDSGDTARTPRRHQAGELRAQHRPGARAGPGPAGHQVVLSGRCRIITSLSPLHGPPDTAGLPGPRAGRWVSTRKAIGLSPDSAS